VVISSSAASFKLVKAFLNAKDAALVLVASAAAEVKSSLYLKALSRSSGHP